tara:strand:- start:3407 stop:4006 length:600 start_codon:yes stop_codon:yes gene_type:complete
MIKLQGRIPRSIYLACSGGVDSMACLNFLNRNHDVTVLHYNHGTSHADKAQRFVENYCQKNDINYLLGKVKGTIPPGRSKEDFWREKRYKFFDNFTDKPLITCHHLDDCVETWIFSSLHGTGKWIPYRRNHIIRPFRLTRKRDFELWLNLNNIDYILDDSNNELCYNRNYIRHQMMPHVLHVNPGIYKTLHKKVVNEVA